MSDLRVLVGHCTDVLAELRPESVHACVTSPPYFRLREYGAVVEWPELEYSPLPGSAPVAVPAQRCELGLEDELEHYVGHLVHVFRAVHRVLRPDGTLWLNLGDTWASSGKRGGTRSGFNERWHGPGIVPGKQARTEGQVPTMAIPRGLKRKDLLGVPWRVAFALQADGWWLRSEAIWHKPNALPDPTEDRLTRAHETIFQFAKNDVYFHDSHAIREAHTQRPQRRPNGHKRRRTGPLLPEHTWAGTARDEPGIDGHPLGRNSRSVWTVSTTPFKDAHFAVMACEVARRCVLASTSARGACPSCLAPHRRVVERRVYDQEGNELPVRASVDVEDERDGLVVGWEPGCGCDAGTVPATVLDPFSGAATTGLVALAEGRSFVGVEFNREYAEMSLRRLRDDASQSVLFTGDGTVAPR